MTNIIRAHNLVKRFDGFTAVDGIDFSVRRAECFGFLGPNGAGKTTTVRMISCVSPVTEGELAVDDMDVRREARRIKSILGVVPQEDNLDPDLSVRQNLAVYARYFDMPRELANQRVDESLALFQLVEKQHEPIWALSTGLKRRLTIARGLLNQPKILVLDEPTTGLDPQARHMVWQKLRYLKEQGVTMLLCTHYMEEAAHLCDRLVIMHQGRILVEGAPAELVEEHAGREVAEVRASGRQRERVLAQMASRPGLTVEEVEDILYIYARTADSRAQMADLILDSESVAYHQANLEDVFLRLTGRGLSE
ncbi:MAG: ABC transporter [Dehalococcoidia bacterium SM23_28_1]|nr:MAG: ABC transporter [Dehalococcoidia bacterium SM23_28_1]